MEIIMAESAGFCFGVDKAVNTVFEQAQKHSRPIYTYGPIIHNSNVVDKLAEKGVKVINTKEELDSIKDGVIVIRSHGVSRAVRESLDREGIICVDATCPFVSKIHRTVAEDSSNGRVVLIAGNPGHPEVEGIKGWAEGPCFVIENTEDAERLKLEKDKKYTLVAQTTFNYQKFQDFVEKINKIDYDVKVVNTICNATVQRQKEAMQIAKKVDAMIVIGDRHSSNSRKLYEICNRNCNVTYFIETVMDLNIEPFKTFRCVGITAGASTPKNIIEEVQNYVRGKRNF